MSTEADEKQLKDYFETEEFKERHVKRALQNIADSLNELEKLGFEPMNADVYACTLESLPFTPNMHKRDKDLPARRKWTVFYDHGQCKWVVHDRA